CRPPRATARRSRPEREPAVRSRAVHAPSRCAGDAARRRGTGSEARRLMADRRKAPATPSSLEQLFAAKEIVIHCGSGGVGKTTTAAAAAAEAAVHLGRTVAVLTHDHA